jgi:hypothetical protein
LDMNRQIYQKAFLHLSMFGIAMSILLGFYDVIFHTLLEFIHTFLEVIEIGLDNIIEHTFETEMRETQIIVFYLMLIIGGTIIYLVWRLSVQVFSGVGENLKIDWLELKDAFIHDWQNMTLTNRVIFIALFLLANYLASFMLF